MSKGFAHDFLTQLVICLAVCAAFVFLLTPASGVASSARAASSSNSAPRTRRVHVGARSLPRAHSTSGCRLIRGRPRAASGWQPNRLFGRGPSFQAGEAGTGDDFADPIYFASRNAPSYKITCLAYSGCEVQGRRVRIPRYAEPAGGSDGHLGVIDRRRQWEYDFWQVRDRSRTAVLKVSYGGGPDRKRGSTGLGSAATAAGFATSAGVIRPQELDAVRSTTRCS